MCVCVCLKYSTQISGDGDGGGGGGDGGMCVWLLKYSTQRNLYKEPNTKIICAQVNIFISSLNLFSNEKSVSWFPTLEYGSEREKKVHAV